MVELIHGLEPDRVRANLDAVRDEIEQAGASADAVAILAAVKYVPLEELAALADAGITLVGENRAQDLVAKHAAHPDLTWDFIGHLQSRKVVQVAPLVRYIHSVASDSVLARLERELATGVEVLIEVNVAGDQAKSGIAPDMLAEVIAGCPVPVVGLMTMPPLAEDPEDSRRWFAALAQLAGDHGLRELSMGTTQDFAVAASEGATIVRIGSRLYAGAGARAGRG